ncbi:hypothetical protein [Halosimplex sp. TS25]|uniref:hypothetical protein n=1 Tax=Halosimplex rarum TaxID=3396619 RepID=UPI0039EB3CBB
MTARRPVLLVALLLVCSLGAAVSVGPATGAPPPEAVCGVCGDGFESAAADAGVPLTVERGAATIDVRGNGTGHWHARVRIDGDAAGRLEANETLREQVVRASLDRRTVVDDPRNLRTSVENDTLVVDFDAADVAHEGLGGVVFVDLLDPRTRRSGLDLEADELRIEGPNGTVVSRAPASGTVDGGAVVWRSEDVDPGLWGDTRLAFAPSNDPSARALTTLGFVAFGVGLAEPSTLVLGVAPALALGVLFLVVGRWGGELPTVDPSRLGKAIAGGGAVVAAVAVGSLAGLDLIAPAVAEAAFTFASLYALVGGFALTTVHPTARTTLAWTLGAALAVAVIVSPMSIDAVRTALLSIPAVLWLPFGRAHGRDRRVSAFVVLTLLVAPFGAALLYAPISSPLLGLLLSLLTTVPWAAATVCFGFPLYLLGRGLDLEARPTDGTDPATRDPSV